jgi:putative hemolysin
MTGSWEFFLLMMVCCLIVQGFYAMLEMASVSFNKVRLQYYVSTGNRRAIWLSHLLHNPARLFGTTLICVNAALQFGSEFSRRFYDSIGFNPDFAPITQVIIVLVFAEISPLLAGRRYAEHAAMIGIPILYATSIVLRPIIGLFNQLCKLVHWIIGSQEASGMDLSRDELQKILEEHDQEDFNTIVTKIFTLKTKIAKELMKPLSEIQTVSSQCTIIEMRNLLTLNYSPFVPVYHKSSENIVSIAFPRDLLRQSEHKRVRDYARSPWFITENESIMAILKQFRRNNHSLAVVLNKKGLATGILSLDAIIDEIFGQIDNWLSLDEASPLLPQVFVDRSFLGEMKIADFNLEFNLNLKGDGAVTLAELVTQTLGHAPAVGESIRIDQFELTVEEAAIRSAKIIAIKTVY